MRHAAGKMVVINDLVRSALGLGMVYLATRLLSRSPVVRTDGPRSVRAAYTLKEIADLATQAG
jgi:hypothetical protein